MSIFTDFKVNSRRFKDMSKIFLDEKGPKIAIYGGTAAIITGGIIACTKTSKAEQIIEAHKDKEKTFDIVKNDPKYVDEYSQKDYATDKVSNYIHTGIEMAKLYRVPLALTGSGLFGIVWGTRKYDKKVTGLTLSVGAITAAINEYRKRVAEVIGEEDEKDLFLGTEVTKADILDEKGKVVGESKAKKIDVDKVVNNPFTLTFGPIDEVTGKINYKFDQSSNIYNTQTTTRIRDKHNDSLRERAFRDGVAWTWLYEIAQEHGITLPPHLITAGWVLVKRADGTLYSPVGDPYIDLGNISSVICRMDRQDIIEEAQGIGAADPIYLCPNCNDIRTWLYNYKKEVKELAKG